MADMTLEEALAAATVDSSTDSDILTISNDLRTITIPESIKNLGVESDEDVNRIHFKMPKTYKDVDLSEFDIRINYINGNDGDKYIVEDKNISEDYITFSWLVGRNALKIKGATRFIVCLKKTDSEGIVQKEFNTTLASLNVLEGLETTEQIMQKYPDIIEQILKKIEGSTTITPDQISEAVEEYMTANQIQAGATEEQAKQIEKNMHDISKLSDEIENLKNGTASCVLTVESITIGESGSSGGTEEIPVESIVLDYSILSLNIGDSIQLAATVNPSNATNTEVTWESSDDSIATVVKGYVTAIASGNVTITARSAENVSIQATCFISVASESTGGEGETTETKIQLANLDGMVTNTLKKKDGNTASVTKGNYVELPYTDGMQISTGQNPGWLNNYPPFIVEDNSSFIVPEYEGDTIFGLTDPETGWAIVASITNYTTTLAGYSKDAKVYVNIYADFSKSNNIQAMINSDKYWYIAGGEA